MATSKETKNAKRDEGGNVIERVQQLVALATNNDNEEEARSAALQAVTLMKEKQLMLVPSADLEALKKTIDGAHQLMRKAKDEKTQNLMIGGLIGMLLGGKKIF